ncbi:MAG: hypothetical protein GXP09_09475 [Gammaproteobacteria bacterium]|nr:hypothetical protein [Gammaproteobacteria bacterium]
MQSKDISGSELTNKVEAKRKRDSMSVFLSFAAISILTALIIGGGAVTQELTREEFELLDKRVKVLESYFTPPGGGTPTQFSTLLESIDSHHKSNLENTRVNKEEIRKLKEDLDGLKRIIAEKENRAKGKPQSQ